MASFDATRSFRILVGGVALGVSALIVVTSFIGTVAAQQDDLQFRTWTDSSGTRHIEAALVVVKEGAVYLQRKDGKVVEVPLERLSAADQKYVTSIGKPKSSETRPPATAAPSEPRDCLVLVQREADEKWSSFPAVFVARDAQWGYVFAARSALAYHRGQVVESKHRVVFYPGTPRQAVVETEAAAAESRFGLTVFKVKLDNLPAPPPLGREKLAESSAVTLLGFEDFRSEASAKIGTRKAKVSATTVDEFDEILQIQLAGEGVDQLSCAMVLDSNNRLVGISQPDQPRRGFNTKSIGRTTMVSAQQIIDMWTPTFTKFNLEAVGWSPTGVSIRFVGQINDPLARIDKMALLVKRAEDQVLVPKRGRGGWERAAGDMTVVKLERNEKGEVLAAGTGVWRDPQAMPTGSKLRYVTQLVVSTHGRSVVYARPAISVPRLISREAWPAYGFLRTLEETLTPHPDGGLVITSDATRQAAEREPPSDTVGDFPQPRKIDTPYEGTFETLEGPPRRDPATETSFLGAWTPAGDGFLCGDAKQGIVRRLSVPELRGTAEIELGQPVAELVLSQSTLLVLTEVEDGTKRWLWALDPETLKVIWRRTYPRLATVEGSPGSPTIFVSTVTRPAALAALDAGSGKPLQVIEVPRIAHLSMTPDGKYLFVSDGYVIMRFRLHGSEMVFEQTTQQINPTFVSRSADGKLLVAKVDSQRVEVDGHPGFSRGVYVYDPQKLDKPTAGFALSQTNPYRFAVGLKSRRVFTYEWDEAVDAARLMVYATDGEALHRFEKALMRDFYLHPDGERLLGQYKGQFFWIDLPEHVLNGQGGLAQESDPAAHSERLLNLLDWKITENDREPEVKWTKFDAGGRAGRPLPGVLMFESHAWSRDGKFLYLRRGAHKGSIIDCFSRERLMVTKSLYVPGRILRDGDSILAMCPEGLLVPMSGGLTVADPSTLQPVRMIFEEGYPYAFHASPDSDYMWYLGGGDRETRAVQTIDVRTGKEVDQWTITHKDALSRKLDFQKYVVLTPDGRHLFCTGSPCLHLVMDEHGKIEELPAVKQFGGDRPWTMPQVPTTSDVIAFGVTTSPDVGSFVCNINDTSQPILASDENKRWVFDPRTQLYWSLAKAAGELIGYDRDGKEKIRLRHDDVTEALQQMEIIGAPPGGGSLFLYGRSGTMWIELPGTQ